METVDFEETTKEITVDVNKSTDTETVSLEPNKDHNRKKTISYQLPKNLEKPNSDSNCSFWTAYFWIIMALVIVIIIALVIYFYYRTRKC